MTGFYSMTKSAANLISWTLESPQESNCRIPSVIDSNYLLGPLEFLAKILKYESFKNFYETSYFHAFYTHSENIKDENDNLLV